MVFCGIVGRLLVIGFEIEVLDRLEGLRREFVGVKVVGA